MELNVAVIGCGSISRFHFAALANLPARVSWVCDVNTEAARSWAQAHSAEVTCDHREILSDAKVQVVHVTTPSATHKGICLDAIAAGKAVICEKTLAENADDALEIVRAAEARQTIFYTSYMKRFIPAVQQAQQLLPQLGRVLCTHIRAYQCWGDLWSQHPAEGFFHTPPGGQSPVRKNYGGGILVCGGSHLVDLVCFLLGRPHRISACMHTPDGRDYDLHASALMETPSGIVHFDALAHPLGKTGFLRDGWDEHIEIVGTAGKLDLFSAQWDNPQHKASLLLHHDNASGQTIEYRYEPSSPFEHAIRSFHQNIRAGKQGGQSRVTGYDVDEILTAIGRASETRSSVNVEYRI